MNQVFAPGIVLSEVSISLFWDMEIYQLKCKHSRRRKDAERRRESASVLWDWATWSRRGYVHSHVSLKSSFLRPAPKIFASFCRPTGAWGTEKLGALRTRRDALMFWGRQDWQGHGKLPISGAAVYAAIQIPVKGKWRETEGKTATELFMLIKCHCKWFQATPHCQLKLKDGNKLCELWREIIKKESPHH